MKSGIHFGIIGIRNGYVFETSMARPRPKAGQVPPGTLTVFSTRICINIASNKTKFNYWEFRFK